MTYELNTPFSSAFMRKNISSIPRPETKFKWTKPEMLAQLILTREVVAGTISSIKENKSPEVDGIQSKILNEIIEQISKTTRTRIPSGRRAFKRERNQHHSFILTRFPQTSLHIIGQWIKQQ